MIQTIYFYIFTQENEAYVYLYINIATLFVIALSLVHLNCYNKIY